MLKRVLHITTVLWLVNALVCFHPALSSTKYSSNLPCCGKAQPANTLLDILGNQLNSKADNQTHSHKKSPAKTRYLVSQSLSLNVLILYSAIFRFDRSETHVNKLDWQVWVKKVFLPPHHHFLFRLSPF